jgi:ubiquinone/menaquinone biosynthesis C-methylase UbiE
MLPKRLEIFLAPLRNWTIRVLPEQPRQMLQRVFYCPVDLIEFLSGRSDELVPRKGITYTGSGDFRRGGDEFVSYFVKLCDLRWDEKILDVGSGMGRIAVALTKYLSDAAEYEGFDVNPFGVEWCRRKISSKFSNFNFRWVNVRNPRYNSKGVVAASQFVFPYPDQTFDFIFATSLFTHTLPEETQHYLNEMERVLKANGRCFVTFFIRPPSTAKPSSSRIVPRFQFNVDGCWTADRKMPEIAVAYEEGRLRRLCQNSRLKIVEPIRYGFWSGREDSLSYQDILILVKNI